MVKSLADSGLLNVSSDVLGEEGMDVEPEVLAVAPEVQSRDECVELIYTTARHPVSLVSSLRAP